MDNLAPVVLFVYNRPTHTLKTLEALSLNFLADQSKLFVFIDGPKKNADIDTIELIEETKRVVNSKIWCKEQEVFVNHTNLGLAESIIHGVTSIINKFGSIIVLEDDLVTSKYFLTFMNQALHVNALEERIACISGYNYPVEEKLPVVYFLKGADCWGWATWKRAWDEFEYDGRILANKILKSKRKREFNFDDSYPYYDMLLDQINGKNSSWAIRWYASAFLNDKLCLYPGKSLVKNIGLDGSGTHSGSELDHMNLKYLEDINIEIPPNMSIIEDKISKKIISQYFRKNFRGQEFIINKLWSYVRLKFWK